MSLPVGTPAGLGSVDFYCTLLWEIRNSRIWPAVRGGVRFLVKWCTENLACDLLAGGACKQQGRKLNLY